MRKTTVWLMTTISIGLITLTACSSPHVARIEQKSITATKPDHTVPSASQPLPRDVSQTYRVAAGDTLYSIAWRFGVDHQVLAKWNGISDPHRIFVGQILTVSGSAPSTVPAASPVEGEEQRTVTRRTPRDPTIVAPRVKPQPASTTVAPPATITSTGLRWAWPTTGTAVRAVSATGSIGLEIKGQRGQPVKAAGAGQVVYSGNGLRGYGQLLIIKHDDTFLSAYAHNDKLLVGEGQRVESGQAVALMGDSEANEVMLHFEIRKNGKAVEPLQFLPQR